MLRVWTCSLPSAISFPFLFLLLAVNQCQLKFFVFRLANTQQFLRMIQCSNLEPPLLDCRLRKRIQIQIWFCLANLTCFHISISNVYLYWFLLKNFKIRLLQKAQFKMLQPLGVINLYRNTVVFMSFYLAFIRSTLKAATIIIPEHLIW